MVKLDDEVVPSKGVQIELVQVVNSLCASAAVSQRTMLIRDTD